MFTQIRQHAYACMTLLCLTVANSSWLYAEDWIYTTRPGDNLWDLSQEYLISMDYWRPLQELNNITEPKQMPPGTRLRIPVAWLKAQPASIRVLEVSGDVSFQSPQQGKASKVRVDDLLHASDEIRTGSDGSVTLLFSDGSRLLLQSNSLLRLDVIRMQDKTGMIDSQVQLKDGRIESTVNPSKEPGFRFEIHTPGAISAVRGTELRVMNNSAEQLSSTEVLTGQVAVSGSGETQLVEAGFGTTVKAGEPPKPPIALLQAPSLAGMPITVMAMPVSFNWAAVNGAQSYRIQLAADDKFNSLLLDINSNTAEFVHADLSDGEYAFRVRAVGANGLEGYNAVHRFVVDTRTDPPMLIEPAAEARLPGQIQQFQWSKTKPRDRYRVQLSRTADFAAPITDIVDYHGTRLKLFEGLAPGLYYWRVSAAHQGGATYGPFSAPHSFEILENKQD